MRYRLERSEQEEGKQALLVYLWEGPYSFAVTPKEQRRSKEFSFDEEGICRCVDWLNECWEKEEERWKQAQGNWQRNL